MSHSSSSNLVGLLSAIAAIATDVPTMIRPNPGESSPVMIGAFVWNSSVQEDSSIGNSTFDSSPSLIAKCAGLPCWTRPKFDVVLSPLIFI